MMENYKSNSNASKARAKEANSERQKLEKVITGTAKVKKKSEIRKFADNFISEDASNVKSYLFKDVLVPGVKKLVSNLLKDGIDMILNGSVDRRGSSDRFGAEYVSYNKYSDRRYDDRPVGGGYSSRNAYGFNEYIFDNRGDAEIVLERLDEAIARYSIVSVADLRELAGLPQEYTDNKYGWTNIRNAEIRRVSDGYLLRMPKALPID